MTIDRARGAVSAVLEVLLLAAMLAALVLGVVRPIVGPSALGLVGGDLFGAVPSVEATMDAERVDIRTSPELPTLGGRSDVKQGDGVEATIPTRTTVAVYDPDPQQFLGLVGSQVLRGVLTVVVLLGLLLLVRSLRHGDPFLPVNARRLYAIAIAVGVGGQIAVLRHAWGRASVVSESPLAPYLVQDTSVSVLPLLAGLEIAVAAEVFGQGAALRADVEGLV